MPTNWFIAEKEEHSVPSHVTKAPSPLAEEKQIPLRDYSYGLKQKHYKKLNDYANQIILQLNMQAHKSKSIVVASYVELDSTLNNTNIIGNQLAEALLVELSQVGFHVVDLNTASQVSITERGTFAFTRDALAENTDYCCVMSGNLIYEPRGVRVNSKVFDTSSKKLLGANSILIPYFVLDGASTIAYR
ncbi:hypothetical protein J3L16_01725 [Alteromonas sp. 5E99-2]|uniref:FlgO family outer membrane protein n=1 Tax=Alteromonas sp. 5E99-2 TaxID=2817683 RepID=UPI001A99C70B|nr:FlgO family outer membrane protein [Alteromonas sp. 5E99-2]MBO1254399.1 hypothetical protein [Alteromonas sp. 5E99-2]